MIKKLKKSRQNPNKDFFFSIWGYKREDFQKWGKKGGRPVEYVSAAERKTAYRRRKARAKLLTTTGILSMKTGRISKYRTKAERQRAYRLRKKLKEVE